MGTFKRLRDMKDMLNAAPGMVAQARELGAQAQEMAATQQAALQAQAMQAQARGQAANLDSPDFEPVAGVSLEQYAEVSKGVAAYGYDQSKLVEIAQSKGIDELDWDAAFQGWNDRIKRNPSVAQRFNQIYRGI